MKMWLHNILIILLLLIFPMILAGQEVEYLYTLFQDKKVEELKREINKFGSTTTDDLTFFRALFLEDGDAAVKIYESLSENASGILQYCLNQKIADYYYARGYYVRAAEWRSRMRGSPDAFKLTHPVNKSSYKIQVGAFGFRDNASKLQKYLESNKIQSEIIRRNIDERTLFCVWIKGKDTREGTEEYAKEIKSRFRLNYQIIQP